MRRPPSPELPATCSRCGHQLATLFEPRRMSGLLIHFFNCVSPGMNESALAIPGRGVYNAVLS